MQWQGVPNDEWGSNLDAESDTVDTLDRHKKEVRLAGVPVGVPVGVPALSQRVSRLVSRPVSRPV